MSEEVTSKQGFDGAASQKQPAAGTDGEASKKPGVTFTREEALRINLEARRAVKNDIR